MQNTATGNILQADNNQLNNNLTDYTKNNRAFCMMAFNQLGNRRDILLTILLRHEQAHNNRAQRPGNRIPASAQTNAEGMLGYADGRRTADSQTDNRNTNKRCRKSATSKRKVFIVALTTFFSVPANSEQRNNIQY